MKNWLAAWFGCQHLLVLVLLSIATSAQVQASVSEFIPEQPVEKVDPPFNRLPAPYGEGSGVHIKDGYEGAELTWDGVDQSTPMIFNVTGINSPITKVEVLLALKHSHINDLTIDLVSPSRISVNLLSRISRSDIPIIGRQIFSNVYEFVGSIGGEFGEFGSYYSPLIPISLISEVDEDDVATTKKINDVTILDQDPTSITYMNTVPPGTYFAQGDLGLFNGLSGTGSPTDPNNRRPANGPWRLFVIDSSQNNYVRRDDGSFFYPLSTQLIMAAQLVITQQNGHKVWTGAVSNRWDDEDNWDKAYGPPNSNEINSIIFPATAARFAPNNDIMGETTMRIADIIIAGDQPYTINLGNGVSFYKRSQITSSGANHTLEADDNIQGQVGRLKLESTTTSGKLMFDVGVSGGIGLKKNGQGTVILNQDSSYTGNTIVNQGILQLNDPAALGAAGEDNYTIIRNSGQISAGEFVGAVINEPLWIENMDPSVSALIITDNQTWNGQIKFSSNPGFDYSSAVSVFPGATLTLNSFDTTEGLYRWFLNGGGTVTLGTTLPSGTSVSVTGLSSTIKTTLNIDTAQDGNIGNIILQNANITGTGAITPRSLGTFATGGGLIASSGTSSIDNVVNLTGTDRSINVTDGVLTMTPTAVVNGSLSKIGGGTLELNSTSTGLPVSVDVGTLAGSGTVGAVSVARQGAIDPTDTFNVTNATFANQSVFIINGQDDELVASGTVDLGGVSGEGGAILQVYDSVTVTPAKTIITGFNINYFDGMPGGTPGTPGITYNPGFVVLNAAGGANTETALSVYFDPSSYVVDEAAGTVTVTAVWSGGLGTALLRNYGGTARRGRDLDFSLTDVGTATSLTTVNYTIPILQNYIQSGDTSTNLALVPQNGARLASDPSLLPTPSLTGKPVATLTILDDDKVDSKPCGFGTGLTVFFLLGFGFLWQLRMRRQ
jgi:autotransporter-associated beta strand protein